MDAYTMTCKSIKDMLMQVLEKYLKKISEIN